MIAASALLDSWERARTLPSLDRAPSLLTLADPDCRPDLLTVGQCDGMLFTLYRQLFGNGLDAVTDCPACDSALEFALHLPDLQPPVGAPVERLTLTLDGREVACRPLRNADLRILSALGPALTSADVLDRCLLSDITAAELPDDLVRSALDKVVDADPGAHVVLAFDCPCGHAWIDQFDIRVVLWAQVAAWAIRTLEDVTRLAGCYGWAERDILSLSAWRRSWYVAASS